MARSGSIAAGVAIREYADGDMAQVVDLVRELQAHEQPLYRWGKPPEDIGPWYIDDAKTWMEKRDGTMLVAERGNTLLGYASILAKCDVDGTSDEVAHTFAHVADLVITRSARGKGIGQALLAECEKIARAKGRTILRIGVLAQNTMAIEAYRKFGFEPYHQTMEKILE
jgi:ribosomal protein S18 acetylase RimI-like enzyme